MRPLLLLALLIVQGAVVTALPGTATAVPPDAVSFTSKAVCDYRAVASLHPDKTLRNDDTLAKSLCSPVLLPYEYQAARDVIDTNPEGYSGYFFVNARTRYFDQRLVAALRAGVKQVVILGAGFDSRAYRFHAAFPDVVFFESDLPAASQLKKQVVASVLGSLPSQVRYVPVDLTAGTLTNELAAAGLKADRKSIFLIEGVTMYLDRAANEALFERVRDLAAVGSEVVYDYIAARVAAGDYEGLYGASSQARGVASLGEPYLSGWEPASAKVFAAQRGFELSENLDAAAMTCRFLVDSNGKPDGRIPEWYYIADAVRR